MSYIELENNFDQREIINALSIAQEFIDGLFDSNISCCLADIPKIILFEEAKKFMNDSEIVLSYDDKNLRIKFINLVQEYAYKIASKYTL